MRRVESSMRRLLNKGYRRRAEMERGQSLVEMAISMGVLVLLLMGLLDLGRAYFVYVALEDAAGEAALYLSIYPKCRFESDGAECVDPNNAQYRAETASGGNIDWSLVSVAVDRPSIYGVGDPVTVTIEYPFTLITPIIPRIAGVNPIVLTGQATQIIIGE